MASLTRWTWVWASSGSRLWTENPGVLQSMGSQRVGHDWVNWTELMINMLKALMDKTHSMQEQMGNVRQRIQGKKIWSSVQYCKGKCNHKKARLVVPWVRAINLYAQNSTGYAKGKEMQWDINGT